MDLINGLLHGAVAGFGEPTEIQFKGRTISYKSKIRFHSLSEPLKTDVIASDVDTGISVNVHHTGPIDETVDLAKEKLLRRLKELGHVKEPSGQTSLSISSNQLKYADMDFHGVIGSGSFSEVLHVTFKRGSFKGHTVAAAKKLNRVPDSEVRILRRVHHPNILAFLDYIEEDAVTLIVTELADESLRKRLDKNKGVISSSLRDKWMREFAEAIKYLHEEIKDDKGMHISVVHRDIKANNCLLFRDTLKVADFGISKETDHTTATRSRKGSEPWMAPELLEASKFSTASDIYALGVLYWEILTQDMPQAHWDGRGARLWGQPMSFRHGFPSYIENLLQHCWRYNYKERPAIGFVITQLQQGAADNNSSDLEIDLR